MVVPFREVESELLDHPLPGCISWGKRMRGAGAVLRELAAGTSQLSALNPKASLAPENKRIINSSVEKRGGGISWLITFP